MRKSRNINFTSASSIDSYGEPAIEYLREMEQIIQYLSQGDRYCDIAEKKCKGISAIKRFCSELRETFHCKTNAQLVAKYFKGEIDVFR